MAGFLFAVAWKGTAVLLVASACAIALRRSSPATRHHVWLLSLIALIALPALIAVGPVWRVEVLPPSHHQPRHAALRRSAEAIRHANRRPALPGRFAEQPDLPKADGSPHVLLESAPNDLRQASDARNAFGDPIPRITAGDPMAGTVTVREWTASVWIAGMLWWMLRLVAGVAAAARIRRTAVPLTDPAWQSLFAATLNAMLVRRPVTLYTTQRTSVPVTCGILRPALLLPADASKWPLARRRAVLLHELAHVARQDCFAQAIAHAARAVHWFNPLASFALRRLRDEQERACDDLVLGVGVSSTEYARHLCDVADAFRGMPSPEHATLAMARPSNLERRVVAILDPRVRRDPSNHVYRGIVAATAACVLPLSALHLEAVRLPDLPSRVVLMSPAFVPPGLTSLPTSGSAEFGSSSNVGRALRARKRAPVRLAGALAAAVRPAEIEGTASRDIRGTASETARTTDFSGVWVLDDTRSASPNLSRVDPRRDIDWADQLVIRQMPAGLRINARRGDVTTSMTYVLDDREYRYIDERSPAGGGTSLRGRDVKSAWDGGKLVTMTRPFSLWVLDPGDEMQAHAGPGVEFVSVRTLSNDGQEMIVERVNRHDWGWGFDGREPSAAYARVVDVYRRVQGN